MKTHANGEIKKAYRQYMKITPCIQDILNMDIFQKLQVWNHYVATQLSLKHDFAIWDNGGIDFLWKNIHITPFNDFISLDNIKITDFGENWKEKGRAERIRQSEFGIFAWYWKFENEIKSNKYNIV